MTSPSSLGSMLVVGMLTLLIGASGCGTEPSAPASNEAVESLKLDLESLQKGEFLIKGTRSPRTIGPYDFRAAGYRLRFQQKTRPGTTSTLTVALHAKPGSQRPPYQLLVDTSRPSGMERVRVRGRLFVQVVSDAESYVLRFTPGSK